MVENFICVAANMFRIYLVYRFMNIFFDVSRVERKKEICIYTIYFAVNSWLYIEFHTAWINVANTLVGMILLSFIYTKSLKRGFYVASLVYILNMVCDVVSTVPFVKYTEGKNTDQILFVAGDFLFLICELLVEKIVDTKAEVEHQKFPLILVPICSVAIVFFMAYSGNELNMEIVVVSMGLLLINFLVLYLYNVLLRALMQSYENEMLNQKLQMYANQLDIITQNEKQIAALRHDLKHHLNELKLLAMQDEGEKIQNYIESMEEFIQNPDEIISSGNTEIDSLLNYMLKRGQKELKEVDVKVQLPEDMSHSYDINVILGNLLENAIEASAMTEDKILRGNISLKQNILKIRIENSYNNNLKKGKSGYITTKPDKRHHGIGLKNVQRVVEKYNGLMEITENDLFCVKIIMYM